MDSNTYQNDPDLHHAVALLSIGFALKNQLLDTLLSAEQGPIEDQIKDIDEQIRRLKEQSAKLEQLLQAMKDLLPKLMAALGSDRQEPICSDSDPRKTEFYRIWDDPVVVREDWQKLSSSLTSKEKEIFAERIVSIVEELGLSETVSSTLYPRPSS